MFVSTGNLQNWIQSRHGLSRNPDSQSVKLKEKEFQR